ncbi:MAG: phosphatase PAP2 family protein [Bacteroidetes bacterium]|nr:phosphatase PAP2 family protein [Bacteroidota bacterium]
MRNRSFRAISASFAKGAARFRTVCFGAAAIFFAAGCGGAERSHLSAADQPVLTAEALYTPLSAMTNVMVDDIFSPPLAARAYAYACLSAWEAYVLAENAAAADNPDGSSTLASSGSNADNNPANSLAASGPSQSLAGKLNGLEPLQISVPPGADPRLSASLAFYRVGAELVFSEDDLAQAQQAFREAQRSRFDEAVFRASDSLAALVAQALRPYRNADQYGETRSLPRYQFSREPGFWMPTAPGYFDAVEPNWGKIRPFAMDSAAQFRPQPPTPYSPSPGTAFYAEMKEVYETSRALTDEQKLMANFWDCNPFYLEVQGHFNYSTKKISPGAHWMGIASTVCEDAALPYREALWVHTVLALALHDAFVSCWEEKYHSQYIRPETAINNLMDPKWVPLLQTPPFPEYTSGHSVASSAAAYVLTQMLGARAFTDSVEVPYGLPARSFSSFEAAALEASLSRMYGGIHFRPAVEVGVTQGRAVGAQLAARIGLKAMATPVAAAY